MAPHPLVVGFDLDLTLIDSRPGIGAVLEALSAETGVVIDVALVQSRLGPPLDVELAHWFPAADVPAMADRFRALYPDLAIESSPALPGAAEALASVRAAGGASVVVTAKYAPNAQLHLDHLGLAVDSLEGWRWAEAKGEALLEHGASVYVGDHPADVAGARAAGAVAVGVTSGSSSAADLEAAGADVVLESLLAFPGWLQEHLLAVRLAALDAHLRSLGSVVVAFSGGADSAFLLAAAVEALGPLHVVAATAVSDSLATGELEQAQAFARELGVRHLAPRTYELARDGYRANTADRCYFCKAELLDVLRPEADRLAIRAVATGTNADDALAGFRPGIRAADERGAITPLRDVGMTKAQIREASRRWGLPTWDKPQAACLSSRVAYGIEVTPARLARVDRAEAALRAALDEACIAVTDLRVRDLGSTARIEVDADAVEDVVADPSVAEAVRLAGFDHVEVDPRGFRSGSMNEALSPTPGARLSPCGRPARTSGSVAVTDALDREETLVPTGKVKFFDTEKGFGFLARDDGGDVFVHASALPDGLEALPTGARVEFGVAEGKKGEQALSVRLLDPLPSIVKAQRRPAEDMAALVEDLIKVLDNVGNGLRRGRYPADTAKVSKMLRAVADQMEG